MYTYTCITSPPSDCGNSGPTASRALHRRQLRSEAADRKVRPPKPRPHRKVELYTVSGRRVWRTAKTSWLVSWYQIIVKPWTSGGSWLRGVKLSCLISGVGGCRAWLGGLMVSPPGAGRLTDPPGVSPTPPGRLAEILFLPRQRLSVRILRLLAVRAVLRVQHAARATTGGDSRRRWKPPRLARGACSLARSAKKV